MSEELKMACPQCGKEIVYSTTNPHRPFCSERCKLIDLGAWANDEYALEAQPDNEEEVEQLVSALVAKHNIEEDY
ncbi:DNA gyrase inhibitor YacG [Psittacicella hinzii]|uniref:DNA gyrase inhibitor YacG n=1 Tax=Psittacicella hinzii TaxID=2028575 RepID=A0A3A1YBT2_9GAMM|nr:DNA gyrase inhibitor YacG [Psittacicella hinzii]RIY35592.1 hypothetical protein CKF58_06620 [Psittacicella hinzii]